MVTVRQEPQPQREQREQREQRAQSEIHPCDICKRGGETFFEY